MANPRPTPKPENLRPPWPPGTSGNPAGYSRGRQISDAIERQIDEKGLDREFGATAIAMAVGKKYMLKRKVKDPETGEEIWFEHKPEIAWFNMILVGLFSPDFGFGTSQDLGYRPFEPQKWFIQIGLSIATSLSCTRDYIASHDLVQGGF